MQWALRPRTKTGRTSSAAAAAAAAAATGFIYIDQATLRRTSAGGAAAVAAAPASIAASAADHQVTMYTTASALARAYGIVIRQVADLLTMLQDYAGTAPSLPRLLSVGMEEFYSLLSLVEGQLRPNWAWLMTVMDSTEAQLRFGSALSNSSDTSHPAHPLYANSRSRGGGGGGGGGGGAGGVGASEHHRSSRSGGLYADPTAGRRDFLQYALSLMRAHHSEHSDSLPIIDIAAMRHIAYAFDSLIYYMRAGDMSEEPGSSGRGESGSAGYSLDPATSSLAYDENDNDDDAQEELPVMASVRGGQQQQQGTSMEIDDEDTNQSSSNLQPPSLSAQKARRHNFFVRSDSTLCLGCPPPDPFTTPLQEALPLADQPQLLQPNALRGDMFGAPKQPLIATASNASGSGNGGITAALSTKLGLANRVTIASGNAEDQQQQQQSTQQQSESSASLPPPSQQQRLSQPPPGRGGGSSRVVLTPDPMPPSSNEPQDLSMSSGASSSSSSAGPSTSKASFTSPKKAFMLRDAATRESERTSSASASEGPQRQPGAPEVLVVPTTSEHSGEGASTSAPSTSKAPQEVSANVTIETTTVAASSAAAGGEPSKTSSKSSGQQRLGGWTTGQVVPHDALLG